MLFLQQMNPTLLLLFKCFLLFFRTCCYLQRCFLLFISRCILLFFNRSFLQFFNRWIVLFYKTCSSHQQMHASCCSSKDASCSVIYLQQVDLSVLQSILPSTLQYMMLLSSTSKDASLLFFSARTSSQAFSVVDDKGCMQSKVNIVVIYSPGIISSVNMT